MKRVRAGVLLVPLLVGAVGLGGCAAGVLTGSGKGGEGATRYASESDARISAEVNRRLVADPLVPAMDVNVDTLDGIVTLSGTVPTRAAAEQAVRLARTVPGVKGLRNNLRVGR